MTIFGRMHINSPLWWERKVWTLLRVRLSFIALILKFLSTFVLLFSCTIWSLICYLLTGLVWEYCFNFENPLVIKHAKMITEYLETKTIDSKSNNNKDRWYRLMHMLKRKNVDSEKTNNGSKECSSMFHHRKNWINRQLLVETRHGTNLKQNTQGRNFLCQKVQGYPEIKVLDFLDLINVFNTFRIIWTRRRTCNTVI